MTPACRRALALATILAAVGGAAPGLAADCTRTSVGITALPELGSGLYQGSQGGLYPGGSNIRPAAHDAAHVRVGMPVPRDAAGNPDPIAGVIGLISCGMSNCTQEYSQFKVLADAYPQKSPRVVIVDCAQGGQTAAVIQDPLAAYWTNCDARLTAAGITPLQVGCVWLKEADAGPTSGWPRSAQTLRDEERAILGVLKSRYPNTASTYLSSRTYAGYASTALNPEPYAYESGFSVKWLVEEQLAGDARLGFDPAAGPVVVPWIAWGPYLWADGLVPRMDGFTWECSDFANDGTHPSNAGRAKVARLLLDFFRSDSTTIPWFLACTGSAPVEVSGLRVAKRPAGIEWSWDSQDGSAGPQTVYDIVQGPIAELPLGEAGSAWCLASDVADTPHGGSATGPVLHFPFEEGAGTFVGDVSGLGNHGQSSGASWTGGRDGGGLRFDGISSIVTVPSAPSLSPLDRLTVALWANPEALTDGVLAAKWISGSDQTWMFRVRPDGTLRVNIVPTLTDATYNNAAGTTSPVMSPGAWHHVAFVYDGRQATDAGRLRILVDGIAQPLTFAAGGIPPRLTQGVAPVSLGLGADGIRAYSGIVDDVRVYPEALSDEDVASLMGVEPPALPTWYRVRARNSCGVGTWGGATLDGRPLGCP